jgi:uncharacterized tellurite resistance protein B-like protein
MHILGLLLAVIAAAGVWYWRFKAMKEVTDDVSNVVGHVRGHYRMSKFKKQAQGSVLASVEDPAMAAAIFLFALANEDEASLHLTEAEIHRQVSRIVAEADLDETLSYARWAAREVVDPRDIVRRFKPLWREKLTREERIQLVGMAEAVAALGEGDEHNQKLSITTLRMALGPDQNR